MELFLACIEELVPFTELNRFCFFKDRHGQYSVLASSVACVCTRWLIAELSMWPALAPRCCQSEANDGVADAHVDAKPILDHLDVSSRFAYCLMIPAASSSVAAGIHHASCAFDLWR